MKRPDGTLLRFYTPRLMTSFSRSKSIDSIMHRRVCELVFAYMSLSRANGCPTASAYSGSHPGWPTLKLRNVRASSS